MHGNVNSNCTYADQLLNLIINFKSGNRSIQRAYPATEVSYHPAYIFIKSNSAIELLFLVIWFLLKIDFDLNLVIFPFAFTFQ